MHHRIKKPTRKIATECYRYVGLASLGETSAFLLANFKGVKQ